MDSKEVKKYFANILLAINLTLPPALVLVYNNLVNYNIRTKIRDREYKQSVPADLLRSILEEIRLLRNEVSLLFPYENLEDYAHPRRLKQSYEKAIKQYPPISV